jgi:hypothetical protein
MMKYYGRNDACVEAYVRQSSDDGRTPNGNIWFEGDVIYSYGTHFPMAVRLPGGFYVLNGDRYSPTTSNHQRLLFEAIPNSRRVEIPFSALTPLFGLSRWDAERELVSRIKELKILDWKSDQWVSTGRYDKNGDMIYDHVLGGCLFEWDGRKFLSSMDESGRGRGLFFLTELADPGVKTVGEAFESMKPEEVKLAEMKGKEIRRQGEHFFVEVKDEEFQVGDVVKKYMIKNRDEHREDRHFATEGFECNGRQFVRGVIRHSNGDHKMLRLYDEGMKPRDRKWFEQFENVQVNSWSARGDVD